MSNSTTKDGKVINFNDVRKAKIEEKRRKYERVMFKSVLGAYCVAEGEGLKAIELVDVSAEGLSFQLPEYSKNLDAVEVGKEMIFRLYFSEDSFVPISVKITNKRNCIESGQKFFRFGCTVDKTTQSYATYELFVSFLTKYAETSHHDTGDMKLFYF